MRDADLQRLCENIDRIAAAAEQLLRATSGAAKAHASKEPIDQVRTTTTSSARDCLRSNPWQTLGIATGLGFLIGCMLSRPSRQSRK